ncbi:MAG: hypothetical protein K6D94_04215, partial [Clostridiales bacterium]|nr:hypothetical protein [Clostridiales bacterium]
MTSFSELKNATVTLKKNGKIGELFDSKYNIQGICFNQDPDDIILIDRESYAGNQIIWLKPGHMTFASLDFFFYDSSATNYLQKMDTQIKQTQVYFDGNGNNTIDGWYDRENNLFMLDENSGDVNLGFFDNTETDEYSFAPVCKLINGEKKLCQYFIKVYYTMTPRCITLPSGHSMDETVRVLPAFTTTVTSDESYAKLMREQKALRYIQAADVKYEEKGDYSDSSAGHLMWTNEAAAVYTLDIPLGGDMSPAVQTAPKKYEWTPNYKGNLMFDFDGPEPILIKDNLTLSIVSIAGENPSVSQTKEDGKTVNTYTYHSDGAERLNGYLGSFYGNSTFAICVNEKNELNSLKDINPQTVNIGTLRTLPNSDYLSLMNSPEKEPDGKTESQGKGEMPEFEVDMGIELPSLEIGQVGLSDYLQVVMDGKSVGFTIGLPLKGYESNKIGDQAAESGGKDFKDSNENFTDLVDFIKACTGKYAGGLMDGGDYIKNMFTDAYDKAKSEKGVKVRNIEVQFSLSIAILFEYNPVDDGYYFQSAGVTASLELAAKFTYRLTVCPIVYFYLKITAAVEVSSGFNVARVAVEGSSIPIMSRSNAIAQKDHPITMDSAETINFTITIGKNMRGFHVTLDGEVFMEIKDSNGTVLNSGKLSSEGEQQEILLPSDYSEKGALTVSMRGLHDNTKITSLVSVIEAKTIPYWGGLVIAPKLELEAGVGVGIDVAKIELYLKIALEMELHLGAYDIDTDTYGPFNMDSFDLGIAIGVNVTLLFFEFSLDLIGYYLHGEQENGGDTKWDSHWGAINDSVDVDKKSAARSVGLLADPFIGLDPAADGFTPVYGLSNYDEQRVSIRTSQPKAYSDMQIVRSAPEGGEEIMLKAFPVTDKNVPFQLSGYGAGSDAIKLADKMDSGYSYKLFKVGNDNYIIYPTSVGGSVVNSVDATMLVMSKVVVNGTNTGLQNPLDPTSKVPFIPVDIYTSDDKNTGDLDFDVYVDGTVVTILFTGYAEQASADELTAAQAAARTVVKKAVIDLSAEAPAFAVTQLTDKTGRYFLPQQGKDVSVYVRSDSGSNALEKYLGLYADYLSKKYNVPKTELESSTPMAKYAMRAFTYQNEKASREVYGLSNSVTAVDASGKAVSFNLGNGETLENIEVSSYGTKTVVAYSTVNTVFTTDTGTTINSSDKFDSTTDRARIKKLCLRTFENGVWSKEMTLETVIDFDSYTSPSNRANNIDGVYLNSRCVKEVSDPYFSNLQFLKASMTAGKAEQIFLYEMNGNTYLVKEADLFSALGGGAAAVVPLFSSAEGTEATIVSDDEGNLAVVYTTPMDGTLNNALYIAWWDIQLGTWGNGNILAMNHMQVFEDAETYDITGNDLEKAYLGSKTDNKEYEAYLENLKHDADIVGNMDRLVFSNLQATVDGSGENATMLALTQGSFVNLKPAEYSVTLDSGSKTIDTVVNDGAASIGFYAVTFGAGEPGIGLGSITFGDKDFSKDSYLCGKVNFTNTGTVGIRAGKANPAEVILTASCDGSSETIAKWYLTENIPAGNNVELDFQHTLASSLPEGTVFSVSITEDPANTSPTFTGYLNLFTLESKAELKFRDFSIDLKSVENSCAKTEVSFTAVNDGSLDAENVSVNLKYRSSDGTYSGIILGSGSKIGENQYISGTSISLGNMASGSEKTIKAELYIPTAAFILTDDFSGLGFVAEIVSGSEEYSLNNNTYSENISHKTFFTVPSHISMALGNTLNLPISYTSTSSYNDIIVRDVNTGEEDWESNMGVLYYDNGRGCVTAAPKKTGNGVLRLEDKVTNSIYAIATTVTELGTGINIYRDNDSFTFYKSNGTAIEDLSVKNQGWSFKDKIAGWTGGDSEFESPMEYDLSVADEAGVSVAFDTVADSIKLWFHGSITVESPLMSGAQTFTTTPAEIKFNNTDGVSHTVKITVNTAGTEIDKYTETYAQNVDPLPPADNGDPNIYWSRSFPDTASVLSGDKITIDCIIIDDGTLASVELKRDGTSETVSPVKNSGGMWEMPVEFSKNETVSVTARDTAGHSSTYNIDVKWFNDEVSSNTVSTAPAAPSLSFTDGSGAPIGTGKINYLPTLRNSTAIPEKAAVSAYYDKNGVFAMNGQLPENESGNRWTATANGYYLVRITSDNGRWSQTVIPMDQIDTQGPSVGLSVGDNKIIISAEDSDGVKSLSVNGSPISVSGSDKELKAEFPISFGGKYTVNATDSAGNKTETEITAVLPLTFTVDPTIRAENGDTIRVTLSGNTIRGGNYSADSIPAENKYTSVTEIAAVRIGTAKRSVSIPDNTEWTELGEIFETELTESGKYVIAVKNGDDIITTDDIDVTVTSEVNKNAGPDDKCLVKSVSATYKQTVYSDTAETDHVWGEPDYSWSADNKSVTAVSLCGNYKGHKLTETVPTSYSVVTEPGPETKGLGRYTAVFENKLFGTDYRDEDIAPTGYTYSSDPVFEWNDDGTVKVTFKADEGPKGDIVADSDSVTVTSKTDKAACETDGQTVYTASTVFDGKTYTDTHTVVLGKTGHAWGKADYEWSADNSSVTGTVVCENDGSHFITKTVKTSYEETVAPKPEETGEGKYTAAFENENIPDTYKTVIIPATGYTYGDPIFDWNGDGTVTVTFPAV